ncbi:MAG: hypothetical protein IPP13_21585 [Kouleothrix sp.]|jgi:septal ring factor EnvC (AmiA/AmiB activator)|nr:hypothetical protein [Kouleothrix sp.]
MTPDKLRERIADIDSEINDLAQKQREALAFAQQVSQQIAYLSGRKDVLTEQLHDLEADLAHSNA